MAVDFISNQGKISNEIQRVRKATSNVWVVLGFNDVQFDTNLISKRILRLSVIDQGIDTEYERVLTPDKILYMYLNIGAYGDVNVRRRFLISWVGENINEEVADSYSDCFATIERLVPSREAITRVRTYQEIFSCIDHNAMNQDVNTLERGRSVSSRISQIDNPPDRRRTRSLASALSDQTAIETSRKHRNLKVIIIGDVETGKTSIAQFLHTGKIPVQGAVRNPDCLGVFTKSIAVDNRIVALDIIDTAGQERFNALPSSYYRNANGVVLVYSCTDRDSFTNLPLWLNRAKQATMDCLPVFILLGNKKDAQRAVNTDEADEYARLEDLIFKETSVLNNGCNIHSAFEALVRKFLLVDQNIATFRRARVRFDSNPNLNDIRLVNTPTHQPTNKRESFQSRCCED